MCKGQMCGTIAVDIEWRVVCGRGGLSWLSEEQVVGVVEQGLERVGDDGLVRIAKVYTIGAEVATGGVNKIGCASVILVQGCKSRARKGTLQWFLGVEANVT